MTAPAAVPRFCTGVRLARGPRPALHAPERTLLLDETADAIVARIDGVSSVEAIAGDLAGRYDAPFESVLADVTEFLADLRDKGYISL